MTARTLCTLLAALAISGTAATARSQGGSGNDSQSLEEIVVYARKTSENQQTVPISMVVNTGEDLERADIVNFNDLTKVTPGLTITSDDPTSTSMKIRGVGLSFFGLAADPGVVITVDEFPQSRIGSVFGAFLDVAQVEVLKGPQGTLYGRNAPSGVISIWSNRPDFDGLHGRMDLQYSSDSTYIGETALNLPLIDDMLAMRLAYIHTQSDGWIDLARYDTEVVEGETADDPDDYTYVYTGEKVNADELDGDSARATVLFEPIEKLSFSARYNTTDYEQGLISAVADGPMIYTENARVEDGSGEVFVADKDDNLMFQDNLDYSDYTLDEWGLRAEWVGDAGRVISLSQYQEFDTELSETIDARPSPLANPRVLTSGDELFSQELRWHSQIGDEIEYLVGAFYADHDIFISYQQFEEATQQFITVFGDQNNESFALFTSWNYALTEQWSFSLGGRYNDETETVSSNLDLVALLGEEFRSIGQVNDDQSDDNNSLSFKALYQYTDDVLFYLALDTAYKSGGYNVQVANVSSVLPLDNIIQLEEDFLQYPAEESEAIEVGIKTVWPEQGVLFNLALFYQDFDNFQDFGAAESERIGGFSLGVLINTADEVNTRGVEMELSWLVSDAWTASLATSWADARVEKWSTNFCDEDDDTEDPTQLYCPLGDGARLNNDAKWNASGQLGYRDTIPGTDVSLFSNLSWSFRGERGGDNDRSDHTLDMNIGIDRGAWSVKVFSRNVLDDDYFSDRTTESEVEGVDNFFLGRNLRPRTFGVTAIYTFGAG